MNRLVCIVEGYGEVQAVPNLCARVLGYLERTEWIVDQDPIRRPRPELVDESFPSPDRPSLKRGIEKAVALAQARNAQAALFLCGNAAVEVARGILVGDRNAERFGQAVLRRRAIALRNAAVGAAGRSVIRLTFFAAALLSLMLRLNKAHSTWLSAGLATSTVCRPSGR